MQPTMPTKNSNVPLSTTTRNAISSVKTRIKRRSLTEMRARQLSILLEEFPNHIVEEISGEIHRQLEKDHGFNEALVKLDELKARMDNKGAVYSRKSRLDQKRDKLFTCALIRGLQELKDVTDTGDTGDTGDTDADGESSASTISEAPPTPNPRQIRSFEQLQELTKLQQHQQTMLLQYQQQQGLLQQQQQLQQCQLQQKLLQQNLSETLKCQRAVMNRIFSHLKWQ